MNRIADYTARNLRGLEDGVWQQVFRVLDRLKSWGTPRAERGAAQFIDERLVSFGPTQARNLLQLLDLTRLEILIGSRVTEWLNSQGLPVYKSKLSRRRYYNFVSDNVLRLCKEADVYPCVLDAAIFASFDRGGWTSYD